MHLTPQNRHMPLAGVDIENLSVPGPLQYSNFLSGLRIHSRVHIRRRYPHAFGCVNGESPFIERDGLVGSFNV